MVSLSRLKKTILKIGPFSKQTYSILLIFLALLFLWLPYFRIGLLGDDLGVVFSSRITSWKDIIRVWTAEYQRWTWTEYENAQITFSAFDVWYRPFPSTILGLQHFLWGNNAYGYYLVNVLFHGLNSVLFFRIFSWFVTLPYSFLGALFLLFHGTVGKWLGLICALPDILNLTFTALVIICYKQFIYKKSFNYYLLSALLFFIGLFNREVIIVLPFCIFLYSAIFNFSKIKTFWKYLLFLAKNSYLYLVAVIAYMAVRIALFGIANAKSVFNIRSLKDTIWTFIETSKDLFGFTFIRTTNPRIGALFIIPTLLFLTYLFYRNSKKKELVLLSLCTAVMTWQSFVLAHDSRYIYSVIPFYTMILLISSLFSSFRYQIFLKSTGLPIFFIMLSFWGIIDSSIKLSENETLSYRATKALKNLHITLQNTQNNKNLIFLGLPYLVFSTSMEQGIKMFSPQYGKRAIYPIRSTNFVYLLDTQNSYHVDILPTKEGYRLISKTPELAFWTSIPRIKEGDSYPINVGRIVVNKKFGEYKAIDIDVILDTEHQFFKEKATFITWDPTKERFITIKPFGKFLEKFDLT